MPTEKSAASTPPFAGAVGTPHDTAGERAHGAVACKKRHLRAPHTLNVKFAVAQTPASIRELTP